MGRSWTAVGNLHVDSRQQPNGGGLVQRCLTLYLFWEFSVSYRQRNAREMWPEQRIDGRGWTERYVRSWSDGLCLYKRRSTGVRRRVSVLDPCPRASKAAIEIRKTQQKEDKMLMLYY
jgi:hypothetical protein